MEAKLRRYLTFIVLAAFAVVAIALAIKANNLFALTVTKSPSGIPNPWECDESVNLSVGVEHHFEFFSNWQLSYRWVATCIGGSNGRFNDTEENPNPVWIPPPNNRGKTIDCVIRVEAASWMGRKLGGWLGGKLSQGYTQQVTPCVEITEDIHGSSNRVVCNGDVNFSIGARSYLQGATLTYRWSDNDCGGTFSSATARSTTWTAPNKRSECNISVMVTDAQGNSASREYPQTVQVDCVSGFKLAMVNSPASAVWGQTAKFPISIDRLDQNFTGLVNLTIDATPSPHGITASIDPTEIILGPNTSTVKRNLSVKTTLADTQVNPSPALAIRATSPFPGFERKRLPIKIQVRRTATSFTNPVIPLDDDSTQGDVDARVANGRVTFHRKSLQTDPIPFTRYAVSPLHKRIALIIKPNNKISFWNLWFDSRVGSRVPRPGKEIFTVPYTFDAEYDVAHFSNDESLCMLITQGRMNNRQKHADIPHTATLYDIVTGRLIKPDKQKTDGLYFTGTFSTPRVTGNQVVLEVRSRAAPHIWIIP